LENGTFIVQLLAIELFEPLVAGYHLPDIIKVATKSESADSLDAQIRLQRFVIDESELYGNLSKHSVVARLLPS
jgi:hypothetical protein